MLILIRFSFDELRLNEIGMSLETRDFEFLIFYLNVQFLKLNFNKNKSSLFIEKYKDN